MKKKKISLKKITVITIGLLSGIFLSCFEGFYDDIYTLKDRFKISYNANGADGGSVPGSVIVNKGDIITVPGNTGNLTRTAYTFIGWNTEADGNGTNYSQGSTFTFGESNLVLYANWTLSPTYNVTYDGNTNAGGDVPVDSTNYLAGATVNVLGNTGNLTKTGYAFAGWNTNEAGTGTTYTQEQTFSIESSDVTLFAKWTALPTYTVTYNGNNNDSGTVPTDSTNYLTGASVTVLSNTGNLTKTGYAFAGWNTNETGTGTNRAPGSTITMGSANVILYAKWVKWIKLASDPAPTARHNHSIIHDGNGHIILFGGYTGSYVGDVWSYDLASQTWTPLDSVSGPAARTAHTAIYDASGNMIIFGGSTGTVQNDVWRYNISGQTWAPLASVSGPAARSAHTAIYDGSGNMIIFGGYGSSYYSDVWSYNISSQTWTQLNSSSGPSGRSGAKAVYDGSGKMLIFGGIQNATYYGDVWCYNISEQTWMQLTSSSGPSARTGHVAIFNGGNIVVYGGYTGVYVGDIWSYTVSAQTWAQLPSLAGPGNRRNHAAASDSDGNLIFFGGLLNMSTLGNDIWRYLLP